MLGRKLLYVRHSNMSQQLLIGALGVRAGTVLPARRSTAARDSGHEPGCNPRTDAAVAAAGDHTAVDDGARWTGAYVTVLSPRWAVAVACRRAVQR